MHNDSSQPASEETMAAVLEGLARGRHWELWIVETAPTPDWPDLAQGFPERFAQALRAHLDWLEQLEADGTLLLSGPVDQDLALGRGLTVLRASSRAGRRSDRRRRTNGARRLPKQHRSLMDRQRRLDHHPRGLDGEFDSTEHMTSRTS